MPRSEPLAPAGLAKAECQQDRRHTSETDAVRGNIVEDEDSAIPGSEPLQPAGALQAGSQQEPPQASEADCGRAVLIALVEHFAMTIQNTEHRTGFEAGFRPPPGLEPASDQEDSLHDVRLVL